MHAMFLFIARPFCPPRRWVSVGLPPTLRRFLVIEPSMSDDCLEYCPASSIGSTAQEALVGFFCCCKQRMRYLYAMKFLIHPFKYAKALLF